jgi:hypothetical protein
MPTSASPKTCYANTVRDVLRYVAAADVLRIMTTTMHHAEHLENP